MHLLNPNHYQHALLVDAAALGYFLIAVIECDTEEV